MKRIKVMARTMKAFKGLAEKAPQADKRGSAPEAKPSYKRDTYHHGDLRQALIARTVEAITELGPARTSLREVARRADVSAAAAFHHFKDKTDLLAAVATAGFLKLIETRVEATRDVSDPARRLKIFVETYVRFAIDNPAMFHLMFGPLVTPREKYPELQAIAEQSLKILAATVRDYVRLHDPNAQHVAAEAWTVWASVHGLSSLLVDFPSAKARPDRLSDSKLVATMVETLMNGIAARAKSAAGE